MASDRVRRLVVVGASLAGLRVVEGVRDAGFDGDVTLIGDEGLAPYDRTVLSKSFLESATGSGPTLYREAASLRRELGAQLLLGSPAHGLDPRSRTVRAGSTVLGYDALVIATGVRPRRPDWAVGMAGVHVLRTVADARALRASLARSSRVVVVGGGFIGSEVASSARRLGAEVTLVEAGRVPLAGVLGVEAGGVCAELHGVHGTRVRCGVTVTALDGGERVERVLLSDGSVLDAETVVVGVGALPNTAWLGGSGVAVGDGVECDSSLRTNVPGVYAVGDVARWYNPFLGRRTRAEHWTSAAAQAAAVARGVAVGGSDEPHASVPYFWSEWYGRRIQFAGESDADQTVFVGDTSRHDFVCLYRKGDRITGALTVGRRGAITRYRRAIRGRAPWHEALEHARGRVAAPREGGIHA